MNKTQKKKIIRKFEDVEFINTLSQSDLRECVYYLISIDCIVPKSLVKNDVELIEYIKSIGYLNDFIDWKGNHFYENNTKDRTFITLKKECYKSLNLNTKGDRTIVYQHQPNNRSLTDKWLIKECLIENQNNPIILEYIKDFELGGQSLTVSQADMLYQWLFQKDINLNHKNETDLNGFRTVSLPKNHQFILNI